MARTYYGVILFFDKLCYNNSVIMLLNIILSFIKENKKLLPQALLLLIAVVILSAAPAFEAVFDSVMSVSGFLAWHNLLEIIVSVAYLAIFLVAFYTYGHEGRLKVIMMGSLMLAAGIIEIFHMLSYKGMPGFFTENSAANRATTFWIAARLMSAAGFLVTAFTKDEKKSTINRYYFMFTALIISASVFISATYFPEYLPAMYIEGSGLTMIKKLSEYFIMILLAAAATAYFRRYIVSRQPVLFTMFTALLLSILGELAFTIYVDVYGIYNFMGHVLNCISLFMIFNVVFSKNVLAPYIALSAAERELREYADDLDKIVARRTSQLRIINSKLMEDLDYARDIQKSMLPFFLPDSQQIGFCAAYMPAERLSGDFYDVFRLDDSHIGFYICDVSGHGVPAAMLTVFLKQCIDSIIAADRNRGIISAPSDVMMKVYDAFNSSNFKDEVYVVLIYFIYDFNERSLMCSSAGMNEMPLLADATGNLKSILVKGFPICKLREVFEVSYHDTEMHMDKGDRLILYTDGLVEAKNAQGVQYSTDRLERLFGANAGRTLTEQIDIIKDDLMSFTKGKKPEDDITLLAVEFR